jgi:hypothetical protein
MQTAWVILHCYFWPFREGVGVERNIMCVLIFSITLYETFLFLRRIQRDIINVHRSSCEVPIILVRFYEIWIFSTDLWKMLKMKISWKSIQWADFFTRTGRRTKGSHTRTSLASESGWARVPMSQTCPCVECHESESTHACVVKYIRAWLPSQALRGGLASQTRTCIGTLTLTLLTCNIGWAPNNGAKWQMGFNSAFKGLKDGRTDRRSESTSCFSQFCEHA